VNSATEAALKKGLAFVASVQEAGGGIVSYSGPTRYPFTKDRTYHTTFVPCLMLQALHALPQASTVCANLYRFITDQRSEHWSFNYWATEAPERLTLPYPDDLDDTFCALIALQAHTPSAIDATVLARIVKLLVATEVSPGGPYRTWLVTPESPKVWHDVDVAVNANVAYFLQRVGSPLPSLADFLYQAIITGQLTSPYYPTVYPLAYYIARAYSGPATRQLEKMLLDQQTHGHWSTPLQTALAVSALRHLNPALKLDRAREFLYETQQADGSWPAEAFCIDPVRGRQAQYHGAEALTTSLVLEALAPSMARPQPSTRPSGGSLDARAQRLRKAVLYTVRAELGRLSSELRAASVDFLDRLMAYDTNHEICLLPHFFLQSLPKPPALKHGQLVSLCAANVYGWIAYTIYDDFLDDEGQPRLLSVANVALRGSLQHFRRAVPDPEFQQLVAYTFDAIDAANTWEVTFCRFSVQAGNITVGTLPSYSRRMQLAHRSLGHTLTPQAILCASGESSQSRTSRGLHRALRQYLIARQISDDLHDWEHDVRAGHISFVVAALLRDMRIKPGTYALDWLVPRMQRQFWNKSLPVLCDTVMGHVAAAKSQVPTTVMSHNILLQLLSSIEASMDRTRAEQRQAQQFLQTFTNET
jgi:hypothetical protein